MDTYKIVDAAVGPCTTRIAKRMKVKPEAIRKQCRAPESDQNPFGSGVGGRYDRFLEFFDAIFEENRQGAELLFTHFSQHYLEKCEQESRQLREKVTNLLSRAGSQMRQAER
jgi:hypothetical protein